MTRRRTVTPDASGEVAESDGPEPLEVLRLAIEREPVEVTRLEAAADGDVDLELESRVLWTDRDVLETVSYVTGCFSVKAVETDLASLSACLYDDNGRRWAWGVNAAWVDEWGREERTPTGIVDAVKGTLSVEADPGADTGVIG